MHTETHCRDPHIRAAGITPVVMSCLLLSSWAACSMQPGDDDGAPPGSSSDTLAAAPGDRSGPARHRRPDHFVTVDGTAFRIDGAPYHFVGANYWQAMNLASKGGGGDRRQFLRELDDMKAHGITNLRIVAASEGPDTEPLRIVPALLQSPGVYNEDLLDGLDFAIKALADRDMKAIMTMGNMWHWSGGFGQYLVWAGVATAIPYPPPRPGGDWDEYQKFAAQFYGNAQAVSYYLDHVAKIVESRPVAPGMFWQPGDPFLGDPPHEQQGWYSVYNSDRSTLAIVKQFSRLMTDLDRKRPHH